MKTAISIPDHLFEAAEMAAKRLGLSRSQFYGRAVAVYLAENGTQGVTEKLNEVYADQSSELDPAVLAMQFASVVDDEW